jgi:hypothetical protein
LTVLFSPNGLSYRYRVKCELFASYIVGRIAQLVRAHR